MSQLHASIQQWQTTAAYHILRLHCKQPGNRAPSSHGIHRLYDIIKHLKATEHRGRSSCCWAWHGCLMRLPWGAWQAFESYHACTYNYSANSMMRSHQRLQSVQTQAPGTACAHLPHPGLRSCPPLKRAKLRQDVQTRVAQPAKAPSVSLEELAPARNGVTETRHAPSTSGRDIDGEELAVALASVANDVKGGDITVLHVAPLVYWTSYLVLVTVFSRPQLQAVLARMEKRGAELGREPSMGAPGRSAWEVLDFGDVVVHVFTAEQREFYDLESFYGAAEEVQLPFTREEQSVPSWTRQF